MAINAPYARIVLLGQPAVQVGSHITRHFRWARVPAFLAFLILNPGEVSREVLAEALWPDRPTETSRQNLRQTLLYVNKILGARAAKVLSVTRHSVGLNAGAIESDVDAFRSPRERHEEHRTVADHERLIELYAGPLLPNLDDEWVVEARAQISRTYFDSLVFVANHLVDSAPLRALNLAQLAVREEPFDDSARAAKIYALRRLGREASAQREYEDYKALLQDQLSLRPNSIVIAALQDSHPRAGPVLVPDHGHASAPSIGQTFKFLREHGMFPEAADLAMALVPAWIQSGSAQQGQELLLSTLYAAERPIGDFENISLARLAFAQGDNVKARHLIEKVLITAGAPRAIAECNLLIASLEVRVVRPRSALRHALKSLRSARTLQNPRLEVEGWLLVTASRFGLYQFSRVASSASRAELIAGRIGDEVVKNHVLVYRAYSLHRLGLREAAAQLIRSVRLDQMPADSHNASQVKCTLGRLQEDLGLLDGAIRTYRQSIEDCKRTSNAFMLCVALTYLGDLLLEMGNAAGSFNTHLEALELRRKLDQNLGIATSLRGIGKALLAREEHVEARAALLESAQRFRDENAVSGHASALLLLAEAEFRCGNRDLALRLAENSVDIFRGLSLAARLAIGTYGANVLERGEKLTRLIRHSVSEDCLPARKL